MYIILNTISTLIHSQSVSDPNGLYVMTNKMIDVLGGRSVPTKKYFIHFRSD